MTARYEKIRAALAMGPTPGPWDGIQNDGSRWIDIYQISNRHTTPIVYVPPYSVLDEDGIIWKESKDETIANAKHVAACDPDTIRELLAERDWLVATLRNCYKLAYNCHRDELATAIIMTTSKAIAEENGNA